MPSPVLTENIFSPCLQIAASHPCNCLSCLCNCVCTELKYLARLFKSHQAIESEPCELPPGAFSRSYHFYSSICDWSSQLVRKQRSSIHCNFCWIDGLFMIVSVNTYVCTYTCHVDLWNLGVATTALLNWYSIQLRDGRSGRYNWMRGKSLDPFRFSAHWLDQVERIGSVGARGELPESATWIRHLKVGAARIRYGAQLEHCSPVCKASIQNIALDQWCGKALCSENCARPTESFLELCSSPWTTDPANEAKDFWQAPQTQLWLTVSATNSSLPLNDSSSLSNTYRRFKLISKGNAKWIQSDPKPKVGLVS